jgi:hypothetical protein
MSVRRLLVEVVAQACARGEEGAWEGMLDLALQEVGVVLGGGSLRLLDRSDPKGALVWTRPDGLDGLVYGDAMERMIGRLEEVTGRRVIALAEGHTLVPVDSQRYMYRGVHGDGSVFEVRFASARELRAFVAEREPVYVGEGSGSESVTDGALGERPINVQDTDQ